MTRPLTLLLLFIACSFAAHSYTTVAIDSLRPFVAVLLTGDDQSERSEIKIYKKNNTWYADNVAPYSYVGNKTNGLWSVTLNPEQIKACQKFLSTAANLPEECPITSNITKNYKITVAGETTEISGDCDWDGMDFFSLRTLLFYDNLAELEMNRLNLIKKLNSQLLGDWYFKPFTNMLVKGDQLILKRTKDPDASCTWTFGKSYLFGSTCNEVLNLSYSKRYLLNVDGNTYMEIQGGSTIDKSGFETVKNFGATFTIDSIGEQEIRLTYLRR